MLLYNGARAPDTVEVRRTYETLYARILRVLSRSSTRHVTDLRKVEESTEAARFEAWQAARYEPYQRPTQLLYRDVSGKRRDRSPPLVVTPTVDLTWRRPPARVTVSDPTGTVPVGIEFPVPAEKIVKTVVTAPVDPDIELFVLSPSQSSGSFSFEQYIESSLACLERDVAEDPDFEGDPSRLRAIFEEVYEPFLMGAGRISAEIERPERTVEPGQPEEFEVTLHPESAGEMMLTIGARVLGAEDEAVILSEMLPMAWTGEDDHVAARSAHEVVKVGELRSAPASVKELKAEVY